MQLNRAAVKLAFVSVVLVAVGCGHPLTTDNQSGPRPGVAGDVVLLRNTNYQIIPENEYPLSPKDSALLAMDGTVLAKVNAAYKKRIDLEGTGKLEDGRVLNYIGRDPNGGGIRYAETIHPFGRGVGNCPLIPYHSAAVDPKVIPLGSVLRIKETVGMLLPDGSRSDGLWKAEDIGGAIKGDRIDLFTGIDTKGVFLAKAGISHLQALTAEIVSTPTGKTCLDEDPR